jgi:hypothetical protein
MSETRFIFLVARPSAETVSSATKGRWAPIQRVRGMTLPNIRED